MAMNVTPFQSTDEFTMAGFNGKISDINSGVDTEITSALSGFARIETGSYVGTGTYGESHPNTLTFNIIPQLVFIAGDRWGLVMQGESYMQILYGSSGDRNTASWSVDGKRLQWYNSNSFYTQMNIANESYKYIAIG